MGAIGKRGGGRLLAVSLLLLGAPTRCSAVDGLTLQEFSFANDPVLRGAELRRGPERWILQFEARFANGCLADAGINVAYADLADPRARSGGTRAVWVRQRVNPEGCPDIFQPVVRRYAAELAPWKGAHNFVVLNYAPEDAARDAEELQLFRVDLEGREESGTPDRERLRVDAVPLHAGDGYPVISRLEVEGARATLGYRYTVRFTALFATSCRAERGATAALIESRLGVSERTGGPVLDWLLVVNPIASDCPASDGPPVSRAFEFAREVRADHDRRLVLLNPVTRDIGGRGDLFLQRPVYPGTP